jgi:hypothetical protein
MNPVRGIACATGHPVSHVFASAAQGAVVGVGHA